VDTKQREPQGKSRSRRWSQEAQVDKTSRKWHKSKVASVSLHRRKKQQKARPRSPLSPFCGASLQRVIAYGHRGAPGGEVSASRVRERGDRVPLKFRRRVFSLMVATPMTLSLRFVVHFLASSTSFFSPISLPKESIHTFLLKNDRTRESMVRKGVFCLRDGFLPFRFIAREEMPLLAFSFRLSPLGPRGPARFFSSLLRGPVQIR